MDINSILNSEPEDPSGGSARSIPSGQDEVPLTIGSNFGSWPSPFVTANSLPRPAPVSLAARMRSIKPGPICSRTSYSVTPYNGPLSDRGSTSRLSNKQPVDDIREGTRFTSTGFETDGVAVSSKTSLKTSSDYTEYTHRSSTVGESRKRPDDYEDLTSLATKAESIKGNRLWPIPFTIAATDSSPEVLKTDRDRTDFIFTLPGLVNALKGLDKRMKIPLGKSLRKALGSAGSVYELSNRRGNTWIITRWSRIQYLQKRIQEGFSPEDIVGELKMFTGSRMRTIACYRYGRRGKGQNEPDRFAVGPEGLARIIVETNIPADELRTQVFKDGMQGYFQVPAPDGTLAGWLIHQLQWA